MGHTLQIDGAYFVLQNASNQNYTGFSNVVNWGASWDTVPSYNGFTIAKISDNIDNEVQYHHQIDGTLNYSSAGSVIIGSYYDMPHSPDLSLTMSREYGGIKTMETKGGSSLSNAMWTKPPMWGDLGAWELSSTAVDTSTHGNLQKLSRSGRRTWGLSFSYLDSSDTFGASQLVAHPSVWGTIDTAGSPTTFDTEDVNASGGAVWDLLSDDNFFSQVIHKTNGGQLPFIFQPDSSNNNPDNFAIAKLDMKSFKFSQVANGVYNMKLKIREVW